MKSEKAALLHNHCDNLQLLLFEKSLKIGKCTPKKRRYKQDMKEFALTLDFYSPRAYNYWIDGISDFSLIWINNNRQIGFYDMFI